MSVADANGQAVGYFAGTPDGGLLQIGSKGGFTGLEAYADEKCGRLRTMNGSGKVLTSLGRTDKGDGEVVAHTRNGNRVVIMRSNDSGDWGSFLIQKEGGEPIVSADGDDKGGYVKTLDGKNDTSRLPSK